MESNRSVLLAAVAFVVILVGGALYLQGRSPSSAPTDPPAGARVVATPANRYLAQLQAITAHEQAAWLPAFNGFQNISDTYDDSWATAHDAATHGIPAIKAAITTLNQQRPPKQFRQAQALLLRKFRLELTLTGYVKAMTTKQGLTALVRLFGPVGRVGKANRLITPRVVRALQTAAAASHLPPPGWAATIN
jgi:hypothetical protein